MAVELKDRVNAGILFVSHNLGVIARVADRVAVMYAGEIVEEAPVRELFKNPRHPYTVGLLSCVPQPPGDDGVVAMVGWRLMAVKAAPCKAVRVCLFAANPHASEACLRPSGRFPGILNQSMPQLTFEDTLGIFATKPVSTKPAF